MSSSSPPTFRIIEADLKLTPASRALLNQLISDNVTESGAAAEAISEIMKAPLINEIKTNWRAYLATESTQPQDETNPTPVSS